MLTTKHYRLIFLWTAFLLLVALIVGVLPRMQIELVSGYQYEIPTNVPMPTIDYNDPFIGNADSATLRVPPGTTTMITVPQAELRWSPQLGTGTGLFVIEGEEFAVSGVDETGDWVRLTINFESAWVKRSETDLPPVRLQDELPTQTPVPDSDPADTEAEDDTGEENTEDSLGNETNEEGEAVFDS